MIDGPLRCAKRTVQQVGCGSTDHQNRSSARAVSPSNVIVSLPE